MTKIFLDTANLDEINEILGWGIISGITTNQKIFSKEKGCDFEKQCKTILESVFPYPVSIEAPNDFASLISKAKEYCKWGLNTVIKVPMLGDGSGVRAVNILKNFGIKTNVTACMTLNQVFLAKCVSSDYVSLFYNRMVDMKDLDYAITTIVKAMEVLKSSNTKLIVGSIRKPENIEEILIGSPDIITIPYKILKQMSFCQKTEETLKEFEKSWVEFKKYENKG